MQIVIVFGFALAGPLSVLFFHPNYSCSPGLVQKPLPCPLLLLYHFQTVNAVSFYAWLNSLCYRRTMLSSYHFQKHWFVQWNMLKHNIHTKCPKINFITKRWRNEIRRRQKKISNTKTPRAQRILCIVCFFTRSKYVRPINFYMLI